MSLNDAIVAKAEKCIREMPFDIDKLPPNNTLAFKSGFRVGYMEGMLRCEDFLNWLHEEGFVEKRVVTGDDIRKWRIYHGHRADDMQYYTTTELFAKYLESNGQK